MTAVVLPQIPAALLLALPAAPRNTEYQRAAHGAESHVVQCSASGNTPAVHCQYTGSASGSTLAVHWQCQCQCQYSASASSTVQYQWQCSSCQPGSLYSQSVDDVIETVAGARVRVVK